MSTLDSVLEYKRQKEAQESADIAAIPSALAAFQAGRQLAQENSLKRLTLQSTLATKGLEIAQDPSGMYTIRKNPNLIVPNAVDQAKIGTYESTKKKNEATSRKASAEASVLEGVLSQMNGVGGAGVEGGSSRVTGANVGGLQIEFPEAKAASQQQAEAAKNKGDAVKALNNYSSDAIQSLVALDKIEEGAKTLGNFKRGVWNQAKAKANVAAKEFGKDKNVTRYLGVVSQELIPAARKLMEEKGPITESDVNRVEKGLGDITAPLEDKLFLINELRNKVKAVVENKRKIAGISDEDFGTKYGELAGRLSSLDMIEIRNKKTGETKKVTRKEAEKMGVKL